MKAVPISICRVISFCKVPHLPKEHLQGNKSVTLPICTVIIFHSARHLPEERLGGNEGCFCLNPCSDNLPKLQEEQPYASMHAADEPRQ
jgi:hypothetical protein